MVARLQLHERQTGIVMLVGNDRGKWEGHGVIKKGINFQCSDAHIQSWVLYSQPMTYLAASAVGKLLGGSWIGGSCELTSNSIKIYANWANRQVMQNLKELVIPLEEISNIEVEKTFTTDIITIFFGNTLIKIRCFKAVDFASTINAFIVKQKT